jgi:hypothetical protein
MLTDIAAVVVGVAGFLGALAAIVRYVVRPVTQAAEAGRGLVDDIHEAKEELADLTRTFLRLVAEYDNRLQRLETATGLPPFRRARSAD